MGFHRLIRTKGPEASNTGYFVPRLYKLSFDLWTWKVFGWPYVKDRLNGWTIWWVENEEDFNQAVKTLKELKKTRIFDFEVSDVL